MPDTARRSAILARAKALRAKADDMIAKLKDPEGKLLVIQTVLHHVDDVEGFFLGDPKSRPSMSIHEDMWVGTAEMVMGWGEQAYASLEKQFAAYGGPEKVQVIGMK